MYNVDILLSNDDGYGAEGIEILASCLRKDHNVWIVAPDGNRSGFSNAMNLNKELQLKKIKENEYTLSGTPTDCVMVAFKGNFLPKKPDLVVSGINRGGNLGSDIIYSGTCGAARQAALYGVPGIALSVEFYNGAIKYEALAEYASASIAELHSMIDKEKIFDRGNSLKYFLNINALALDSYKGCKAASVSERIYGDKLVTRTDKDGNIFTSLVGTDGFDTVGKGDFDVSVIEDGYISISKISTLPECL